jgi:hypothetical protein
MGDRAPTCIYIAGRLENTDQLSLLAKAAIDDGVGADWGNYFDSTRDVYQRILEAIEAKTTCSFYDEQCNYGTLERLQLICQQIGLAFTHMNDAGGGYGGGIESWMPGWDQVKRAEAIGNEAVVPRSMIRRVLEKDGLDGVEKLLLELEKAEGLCEEFPEALSASDEVLAVLRGTE